MSLAHFPTVSICIISKGRSQALRSMVPFLFKQSYPKDLVEVVVVEETNNPAPIVNVVYEAIPEQSRGYSYARNRALEKAKNEIIVFIDDDCEPVKDWLVELVQPLAENNQIAGCAGAVKVKKTKITGLCENVLGFPGGGLKYIHAAQGKWMPTRYLSTLNCAYRKKYINEMDGFEEKAKYGSEDYLLAQRISSKYDCIYNPKAIVFHAPRESLIQNFKWFTRRGIADAKLIGLMPNKLNKVWMILTSSIILKFLFIWIVLSWFSLPYFVWIVIPFLFYYLYNLVVYSFSWQYLKNIKVLIYTPIVKFVMDLGMDLGRMKAIFK